MLAITITNITRSNMPRSTGFLFVLNDLVIAGFARVRELNIFNIFTEIIIFQVAGITNKY